MPDFPQVPPLTDLARTKEDKAILDFMASSSAKDPAFLADAKRVDTEIAAMTGEKVQEIVARALALPPELVKRAKAAIE